MTLRWGYLFVAVLMALPTEQAWGGKILLAFPMTKTEDYQKGLEQNPEAISLIDYFEAVSGYAPTEESCFYQNPSWPTPADDDLLGLAQGFLSPLKRTLLIKALEKNAQKGSPSSSFSWGKTREALLAPPSTDLKEGVRIPWLIYRPEDRLYLNGQRLTNDQLSQLRLDGEAHYHWAYYSSTSLPVIRWARPQELEPLSFSPLIHGTCQNEEPGSMTLPLADKRPFSWKQFQADESANRFRHCLFSEKPSKLFLMAVDEKGQTCAITKFRQSPTNHPPSLEQDSPLEAPKTLYDWPWKAPKNLGLLTGVLVGGAVIYQLQKSFEIGISLGF